MNKRITAKEQNLIKGALRRVFSRSDLRKAALAAVAIEHSDPERPRVKKWSRCPLCLQPTPQYIMEVDHLIPVVKTTTTLLDMSADELVDSIWCDPKNLQAICPTCHKAKTAAERKERTRNKKESRK